MASRISIHEQLQAPFTRPQEVMVYTKYKDGHCEYDTKGSKYYYSPRSDIQRSNIDLSAGFDPKRFNPDDRKTWYIDSLLERIIHYERRENKKSDAQIVSWRGTWTQIISLSQPHADRRSFEKGIDLLVVGFDGQIFISPDSAKDQAAQKAENEKQEATETTEEKFKRLKNLQFTYTGYRFEYVAMLDKPWGECTREEIEGRYTDKTYHDDECEYGMSLRSKIGNTSLMYAAETDGVVGYKPKTGDVHRNYIELKTSNAIYTRGNAIGFERKSYKTWIQSFLSRVPQIVYGFRDPETMKLVAIEHFKTEALPKLVSQSTVSPKPEKWSAKRTLGFFGIMVQFLKDRVEDGKTYRLTSDPQMQELVLTPDNFDMGRKVAFLTDEFVEWREQSKQAKSQSDNQSNE